MTSITTIENLSDTPTYVKMTTTGDASNPFSVPNGGYQMPHEPIYYEIQYPQWHTFRSPPVTLRQWFDLLADIFGEERCTPFDQMELLMCLKEQGFEL